MFKIKLPIINLTYVQAIYCSSPVQCNSGVVYHITIQTLIHSCDVIAVPQDDIMSATECNHPEMRVYDKHTLPKRLHYTGNDRIEDIVVLLDDTYTMDRYTDKRGPLMAYQRMSHVPSIA